MARNSGELLVGTRPSSYVLSRSSNDGTSAVYGPFDTQDEAGEAGTELANLIGTDYAVLPVIRVRQQSGRRGGRKPRIDQSTDGQSTASTEAAKPSAPRTPRVPTTPAAS